MKSIFIFKKVTVSIILFAIFVLALVYQEQVSSSILTSMTRCITQIVPSLFAASILSSLIQKFNVFPSLLSYFILGNIGGYQIGAKLISDDLKLCKLSPEIASYIICFSFSCGPAFAIKASYLVYGNAINGLIYYLSSLVSNAILLFLLSSKHHLKIDKETDNRFKFTSSMVIDSVYSSANAMFSLTSIIAAFSLITSLIFCVIPITKSSVVSALLEISNIVTYKNLNVISFIALLSIGGLCVNAQMIALISNSFSLKRFYISRLIQIPLTIIIYKLIAYILSYFNVLPASKNYIYFSESNSIIPFICMIFILIISFNSKRNRRIA